MSGRHLRDRQIGFQVRKGLIFLILLLVVCQPAMLPAASTTAATAATKPAPQGGRVVVGVASWGTENPHVWHQVVGDKRLWDHMFDALVDRDPDTAAHRPGLATEWKSSKDFKTWTFKLRPGVQFHENWGEVTAEDVKFTVEQHRKPGATGGAVFWVKQTLDRIETPDKYTVVLHLKQPAWDVPTQFSRGLGYMNIASKKYLESVGEDKARLRPIGSGPFKYVEGRHGDYHRFEAVPNHWLHTPGFKELVVRLIPEQAAAVSALRAGEVDIIAVTGDFLKQAKQAGFRIHEIAGGLQYWIVLPGQTTPEKQDYCPACPWVGDPKDPKSLENAKKIRLALSLAVNKQAIVDKLWSGYGRLDPFGLWYYPNQPGFSKEWKILPYDPQRAKQLLAEAGYPKGFEITMSLSSFVADAPDVAETVALDWERIGIKVKRYEEPWTTLLPKVRQRKTGRVALVYPGRFSDEPVVTWDRSTTSWGGFNYAAESPEYDQKINTIKNELDSAKRAELQSLLAKKMYDDVRVVMIAWKSNTFAMSKRIGNWRSQYGAPQENNLDFITWSGQ
jgi:peptide/nickel transport system substrate-binding protein